MKKRTSKLLALLLTLVMVLGMLPMTALAADPAPVDYTLVLKNGKVYKDSSTTGTALTPAELSALGISATAGSTTYTFNNVNFVTSKPTGVTCVDSQTTIMLVGTNSITSGDAIDSPCYGIYTGGNLTINGSGADSSSLSLVTGSSEQRASTALETFSQDLTINNCTLSAVSNPKATTYWNYGIRTKNLSITNSIVSASCGPVGGNNCGFSIEKNGSAVITDSTVTAHGTSSAWYLNDGAALPTLDANAEVSISTDGSSWTAVESPDAATYKKNKYIKIAPESGEIVTPTSYTITATAGANGSISPSGAVSVNAGEDKLFTVTADSNYVINQLLVDGVAISAASGAATYQCTFADVAASHTISATFEKASTPGEDTPISIESVDVFDVVEPVIGADADFTWSIPDDADYAKDPDIDGDDCVWVETSTMPESYNDLDENDVWAYPSGYGDVGINFEKDKYYTFIAFVKANEGAEFPDPIIAQVNGCDAFALEHEPGFAVVWYTFGPLGADDTPTTPTITVTPETATVAKGETLDFDATVTGLDDTSVTWSVEGNDSDDTDINGNGTLTVGEDETATELTVKATANAETPTALFATAIVAVTTPGTDLPTTQTIEIPFKKIVVGEDARSEIFTFFVKDGNGRPLSDPTVENPVVVTCMPIGTEGPGTYERTIYITGTAEQIANVKELGVSISEKNESTEGWTYSDRVYLVQYSLDTTGAADRTITYSSESEDVTDAAATEIVFTNTYNSTPTFNSFRIPIALSKTVELGENTESAEAKTFEFEIFNLNETLDASKFTINDYEIATTGANTYTKTMVVSVESEEAYNLIANGFFLREKAETSSEWAYSEAVYHIVPNATDASWSIYEATLSKNDKDGSTSYSHNKTTAEESASFINTYTAPGTVEPETRTIEIPFNKDVVGKDAEDKTFYFEVAAYSPNISLEDVTITGNSIDTDGAQDTPYSGTITISGPSDVISALETSGIVITEQSVSGDNWIYDVHPFVVKFEPIEIEPTEPSEEIILNATAEEDTVEPKLEMIVYEEYGGELYRSNYAEPTFTNIAPYTITIPMEKFVKNGGNVAAPSETFTFELDIPDVEDMSIEDLLTISGNTLNTVKGTDKYNWDLNIEVNEYIFYYLAELGFYLREKDDGHDNWKYSPNAYHVQFDYSDVALAAASDAGDTSAEQSPTWLIEPVTAVKAEDGTYSYEPVETPEYVDVASFTNTYTKNQSSGGGGGVTRYILTYESNGGTIYPNESYSYGTKVDLNKTPTREGYDFTGWYSDKGATNKITSVTMTSNKTVYAGWSFNGPLNTKDHVAYVKGYPDGTVGPNNNITRAETAVMLYRLLTKVRSAEITTTENTFSDVSTANWYNTEVSSMAKGGYVFGYEDGTFGGDKAITRAEFVTMMVRFINPAEGTKTFTDVPTTHWAYKNIATATAAGWIDGYTDGSFGPDKFITRAEAMTIINRVLNRGVDEDSTLLNFKKWPDNKASDWFYYDVIEATNGHEYTGSRPSEDWTKLY